MDEVVKKVKYTADPRGENKRTLHDVPSPEVYLHSYITNIKVTTRASGLDMTVLSLITEICFNI